MSKERKEGNSWKAEIEQEDNEKKGWGGEGKHAWGEIQTLDLQHMAEALTDWTNIIFCCYIETEAWY